MSDSPLDVEQLLQPISAESPCGDFLIYEGTYEKIQAARSEDDPSLARGVWERELKKADWKEVERLCVDALQYRTKDLQIAVWLLEAFLHRYQFAGVQNGLRLLAELCEKFWDCLYPQIDDDMDARLAPVEWMNDKLFAKLKLIPITQPTSSANAPVYNFADKERSDLIEKLPDEKKINLKDEISQAIFLKSVMHTPASFYQDQFKILTACLTHLKYLDSMLEERCKDDAPGLKNFRDVLENIKIHTHNFLKTKGEPEEDDDISQEKEDEKIIEEALSEENFPLSGSMTLSIRGRDHAYRLLSEIADYLLIREPHSPVPHLIKRAVAWGDMPLEELMKELVRGETDRNEIFSLLGWH